MRFWVQVQTFVIYLKIVVVLPSARVDLSSPSHVRGSVDVYMWIIYHFPSVQTLVALASA